MNNAWRIFGIVAAFIFVFLFGAVIGGSTMVLFSRNRFRDFREQREREMAQRQRERVNQEAQQKQLSEEITQLRSQLTVVHNGGNGSMIIRRGPIAPEQFGPHLMQMFANQLQLTPDQQQKVHALVFQSAEDLRRLSRDTAHNSQIEIEKLEDQISALLTSEQRDRFNEMITRGREAFQRWSAQQQQWRAQQRMEQQGWHRQGQSAGKGPGQPAPAGPNNPAPAAPSNPATPPASAPSTSAPAVPAPAH